MVYIIYSQSHDQPSIPEYVGMDQRIARQNVPGREFMPESPLYPGGPTWEEIINGTETNEDYATWS